MISNKKVILLLSGGFDSTVAGYLLSKVGFQVIPLHFSNVDFVGDDTIVKCQNIAQKFGWSPLYVVDIAEALQSFVDNCTHSYYFVLMKRLMLRLGSNIATEEKADYIATGESLGQVSSQTLKNINAIERATSKRVIKPLITFSKEKIISVAKEIGTFEISAGPEICDLLGPKHPVTAAIPERVEEEEEKLDYAKLIQTCLSNKKVIG